MWFHKVPPVLESLFNKAAAPQASTLLKRDFNTGVNLLKSHFGMGVLL